MLLGHRVTFAFLLNSGSSDEARAKTFIGRFQGPEDPRYCEVGLLIFGGASIMRIILEADTSSAVIPGAGTQADDPHLVPSVEWFQCGATDALGVVAFASTADRPVLILLARKVRALPHGRENSK